VSFRQYPILSDAPWQMSYGERAALTGLLATLRPELSVEIGRAEGGSLRCLAAYSTDVVSFDLVESDVVMHGVWTYVGDSHVQLPKFLADAVAADRTVDFVLVDGDHTTEGVRQDIEDLLASPAIRHTVIVAHDSLNPEVRAGLTAVDYEAAGAWIDLDFVPGCVVADTRQRWRGLALIVVDATGEFHGEDTALVDHAALITN
jgi:hypothetical protein